MPAPVKHIPQRTCIACRQVKPKRELVRVVRTPAGSVEVDTAGKKAGRGAYLCRDTVCWESGLRSNRLDYVLKTMVTAEDKEKLKQTLGTLTQGEK